MMFWLLLLASSSPYAGHEKLISQCDAIAISHGGCGNIDKPVWKSFKSSTSLQITKLDTQSVQLGSWNGVVASIYTYFPGENFDINSLKMIYFTCKGQYQLLERGGNTGNIPKGSVLSAVANSACALAVPKRQKQKQEYQLRQKKIEENGFNPPAIEYCKGFSEDACSRIQAGVNARVKPGYCVPGYGLPSSGLSGEQQRICAARSPKDMKDEEAAKKFGGKPTL